MTSTPPGDGENEQTRASSPQGGAGSGGYGSTPPSYPQGGGYQQGGYQQGAYQQGGYQQSAYPQGGYPSGYPGGQSGYQQQPSYYSQPGYPGSYPADRGAGPAGPPSQNFFTALFDFNFSRFATPSVIKILYILIMVVVLLTWLGYIVVGFVSGEPLLGIAAFVGGGVFALLTITYSRVILEFFYAVVRMSEDIHNRK